MGESCTVHLVGVVVFLGGRQQGKFEPLVNEPALFTCIRLFSRFPLRCRNLATQVRGRATSHALNIVQMQKETVPAPQLDNAVSFRQDACRSRQGFSLWDLTKMPTVKILALGSNKSNSRVSWR